MLLNSELADVAYVDTESYLGVEDEEALPNDPIHSLFLKVLQTAIEDLQSVDPLMRSNALEFFKAKTSWLPWGISYVDIQEFYPLSAKNTQKVKNHIEASIDRFGTGL